MKRHPSYTPNNSWSDPDKRSDFQYELSIANEPVLIPSLEANPAFAYIAKKGLEKKLYAALDKLAPLLPVPGFNGTPLLWFSPPPSGSGNRVGLVLVEDAQGNHKFVGSNFIGHLAKPIGGGVPPNLFDLFKECKSYNDATALIVGVLNGIVDIGWRWAIEKVEWEGQRFRTMPIYFAIVTRECTAFYCSSARLEGDFQSKMEIEYYGELVI